MRRDKRARPLARGNVGLWRGRQVLKKGTTMADRTDDMSRLAQLLSYLGYDIEGAEGDKGLRITTNGVHVTVVVYDDGSLSLVCTVAGGGVDLRLADINDANNRVRFAKFSKDDDQLILEADFMFSLEGINAQDELRHIMSLWTLALQELKHLVRDLLAA
jgi:hypothetical protein